VLDVYDTDDNFIENGTDWSYFATEEEAGNFCKNYNYIAFKEAKERKKKALDAIAYFEEHGFIEELTKDKRYYVQTLIDYVKENKIK